MHADISRLSTASTRPSHLEGDSAILSLPPCSPRSSRALADGSHWTPPGPGKNYFSLYAGTSSPDGLISKAEFVNLHQAYSNVQIQLGNLQQEAHAEIGRLEEAMERLKAQNSRLEEQLKNHKKLIKDLEAQNNKLVQDLEANTKAYNDEKSKVQDYKQNPREVVDQMRRDHDQSFGRLNQEVDDMRMAHREKCNQLRHDHEQRCDRVEAEFQADRCKLEQTILELRHRMSDQGDAIEDLQSKLKDSSKLKDRLSEQEGAINDFQRKLKNKDADLEAAQEAHSQLQEARKQIRGLEIMVLELKDGMFGQESTFKDLQRKTKDKDADLEMAHDAYSQLERKLKDKDVELRAAQEAHSESKKAYESFIRRHERTVSKLEDATFDQEHTIKDLHRKLKERDSDLEVAQDAYSQLKRKLKDRDVELRAAQEAQSEFKKAHESLIRGHEMTVTELKDATSDQEYTIKDLHRKLKEKDSDLRAADETHSQLERKLQNTDAELRAAREACSQLEKARDKQLRGHKIAVSQLKDGMSDQERTIKDLHCKLKEKDSNLRAAGETHSQLERKLKEMDAELGPAQGLIKKQLEEKAAMQRTIEHMSAQFDNMSDMRDIYNSVAIAREANVKADVFFHARWAEELLTRLKSNGFNPSQPFAVTDVRGNALTDSSGELVDGNLHEFPVAPNAFPLKLEQAVPKDSHDNPEGAGFDLAKDNAFQGFRLLIGCFYTTDLPRDISELTKPALEKKGFEVHVCVSLKEFTEQLDPQRFHVAWAISGNSMEGDEGSFVQAMRKFHEAGRGLMIWAYNDPYFMHANAVLDPLFKFKLTGNTPGGLSLTPGDPKEPGKFGGLAEVCAGINTLHEGVTICYPTTVPPDWIKFGTSSNNQPVLLAKPAIGEIPSGPSTSVLSGRVIVDNGFTKLMKDFWNSAGTARYVSNCAAWLALRERFKEP